MNKSSYIITDPLNGNLAFRLFPFEDDTNFNFIQRHNYYSVIWVRKGAGKVKANFSTYDFTPDTLFAFSPYQPFMLNAYSEMEGVLLNFHPDFYCIHQHKEEVSCRGILFTNVYQQPFVELDEMAKNTLRMLLTQIESELKNPGVAQHEALVSYMKIFLIIGSRLKKQQILEAQTTISQSKESYIIEHLISYIELHFKTKHSARDYEALLDVPAKVLAKITKLHFKKTLSHLINDRIIIEAKMELFLTNKTIKEIAYDLGYEDESYFSRFFKLNADVSPQMYRDTVGYGKRIA